MMRTASLALFLFACGGGSGHPNGDDVVDPDGHNPDPDASPDTPANAGPRTIFVIPLENKDATAIYGNTADAPYINGLFALGAHATNFQDELTSMPSEPHYVWMEAGTNQFADRTFTNDNDASSGNSTASTDHLTAQLNAANIKWMSYQEGISAGTCPISSTGNYAAKHDPFVFFKDIAGSPPANNTAGCMAHHKPYSSFVADLAAGVEGYIFITPDICHDMHGALNCPSGIFDAGNIKAGDTWLKNELPRIIDYAKTHDALIFVTWDEGNSDNLIPFIALGKGVKAGYTSNVMLTHSSMLKSTEQYLGVPVLASVTSANNFADMYAAGTFGP